MVCRLLGSLPYLRLCDMRLVSSSLIWHAGAADGCAHKQRLLPDCHRWAWLELQAVQWTQNGTIYHDISLTLSSLSVQLANRACTIFDAMILSWLARTPIFLYACYNLQKYDTWRDVIILTKNF